MPRIICWLTGGHKLIHKDGSRDNNMQIQTNNVDYCTNCTYRKVEKL